LNPARLTAYGLLGAPLAAAALPIYVHIPKLYADDFGVPLTLLGIVLFLARLLDAVLDPLIGAASDRARGRRILVLAGLLPLAIGLLAMVRPAAGIDPLAWLVGSLVLVYAGYSLSSINYAAWGAELSATPALGTRLVATREGCALIGVVAASIAPGSACRQRCAGPVAGRALLVSAACRLRPDHAARRTGGDARAADPAGASAYRAG
jgi:GPH family glycoside/pentoside/hexuronide:cation symporter